ncbi:MAG TPA: membrane dipeptidase [Candidatus Hydrogenedentes bacterium]|nr:membrane dipeptidase [Candidatus Hydrogenedentota bacterium]
MNEAHALPSEHRFGVIDLHMHPTLKTFMLGKDMMARHHPPGFFFPLTMRTDLDALLAGGVKAFLSTIYIVEKDFLTDVWPLRMVQRVLPRVRHVFSGDPFERAWECLDHQDECIRQVNARRGPTLAVARSVDEMLQVIASGRIAILLSVEGAHHLSGNLEHLEKLHQRGVCHMIIPHLYPNEACWNVDAFPDDVNWLRRLGCFRQEIRMDSGLTDFGRAVVDRMFDLGMIVDVTHATPRCRQEVYERQRNHPKRRPVIFSHVGIHAMCPHPMNPTDEEIRTIADTGGVIGLIAMAYYLSRPVRKDGLNAIIESIDHMVRCGGEEVVAFGSDFDGFTGPPPDFKSPRDYAVLRDRLLKKYTERQVEKFLNGNALRVLREGWTPPVNATATASAASEQPARA